MPLTVVASSTGRQRILLDTEQLAAVARLPTKVASQVRSLSQSGWFEFARSELPAGRNPAAKGWRKVFCDALLAGGATRRSLEMAMTEQLDMSAHSARVQVSVAMSIFAFGRVATEQFGQLTISQN